MVVLPVLLVPVVPVVPVVLVVPHLKPAKAGFSFMAKGHAVSVANGD